MQFRYKLVINTYMLSETRYSVLVRDKNIPPYLSKVLVIDTKWDERSGMNAVSLVR